MTIRQLGILAGCTLMMGSPSAAQEAGKQAVVDQNSPIENEIVVTAQRSGAPMWTIPTPTGTVLLVGEIRQVPKSTPWFPDKLEEAAGGAQRVILGIKPKISPGDIFRLIFAGGKLTKLPKGTTASDYIEGERLARLKALETRYAKDYSERSFLMSAFDLLSRRLGFTKDTGKDATEFVKNAARRAKVEAEPVGTVRGEDLLDSLAAAPPKSHLPCLDAAMDATEQGAEVIERRGQDWRASDIPAVMANPLEIALGRCWPWTDQNVGSELRSQWVEAIGNAAASDGVTLAVVPLRILAEDAGVLDQLVKSGFEVNGPIWRAEEVSLVETGDASLVR